MTRLRRRAVALLGAGATLLVCWAAAPARGEFHQDLLLSAPAANEASVSDVQAPPSGQEGRAAYYAKRFNGRRTTSGERYRPQKLTAAHQDFPLGTRVRVTHLDTGREVIVRVNDRCRKRREPFIDLSRAAAKELGFLGKGVARVRIEPLVEGLAKDEALEEVVWAEGP